MSNSDFPEGCAVVFGGSGGIGQAIARLLACRGCDVAVAYFSRPDKAGDTVKEIRNIGRQAIALQCDVSSSSSVRNAFESGAAEFGRIHTVIYAGGRLFDVMPLADFPEKDFRAVIETDVIGFFNIAQAGIPHLRRGQGGSFTALITPAIVKTFALDALSAVPKTAVAMLIRHIAAEEGRHGIRANAVGPGFIDAGMTIPMRQNSPNAAAVLEKARRRTPIGRLGQPQDVAEVVAFLASSKASFVTGQIMHADGGLSA